MHHCATQDKEQVQLAALLRMHELSGGALGNLGNLGSLGNLGAQGSSNLPYILRSLLVRPMA
jgi:hypothetical protein